MTKSTRAEDVERAWLLVDASDKVLGRLASQVASLLRGKHKPTYTYHVDDGDYVVVVNAGKIRVTGRKRTGKIYYRHTGHPGSVRAVTLGSLLESHPDKLFERAVQRMLPSGPLARHMLRKLKVYAGPDHPHSAQQPRPVEPRT